LNCSGRKRGNLNRNPEKKKKGKLAYIKEREKRQVRLPLWIGGEKRKRKRKSSSDNLSAPKRKGKTRGSSAYISRGGGKKKSDRNKYGRNVLKEGPIVCKGSRRSCGGARTGKGKKKVFPQAKGKEKAMTNDVLAAGSREGKRKG